jgi:hypothetical protein
MIRRASEETYIIPIYIDISFNKEERQAILKACDKWFEFSDGMIYFNPIFSLSKYDIETIEKEDVMLRVSSDFYMISDGEKEYKTKPIGYYRSWNKNRQILLLPYKENKFFLGTIMHELGHSVGLMHIEGQGVMHQYTGIEYFTIDDQKEFERIMLEQGYLTEENVS